MDSSQRVGLARVSLCGCRVTVLLTTAKMFAPPGQPLSIRFDDARPAKRAVPELLGRISGVSVPRPEQPRSTSNRWVVVASLVDYSGFSGE
jgi:hypothetical protein